MTLLAQYTRRRHRGNRTTGPRTAETSVAFALCCPSPPCCTAPGRAGLGSAVPEQRRELRPLRLQLPLARGRRRAPTHLRKAPEQAPPGAGKWRVCKEHERQRLPLPPKRFQAQIVTRQLSSSFGCCQCLYPDRWGIRSLISQELTANRSGYDFPPSRQWNNSRTRTAHTNFPGEDDPRALSSAEAAQPSPQPRCASIPPPSLEQKPRAGQPGRRFSPAPRGCGAQNSPPPPISPSGPSPHLLRARGLSAVRRRAQGPGSRRGAGAGGTRGAASVRARRRSRRSSCARPRSAPRAARRRPALLLAARRLDSRPLAHESQLAARCPGARRSCRPLPRAQGQRDRAAPHDGRDFPASEAVPALGRWQRREPPEGGGRILPRASRLPAGSVQRPVL
ncbi:serine/arginine repetitive matrix protein 1-like [Corvus hawaiiensis]|uniref:serine/arginine repetitive matrix protein 1-like n=1 Tax=Corvus hawaiiensis TaxID=134902 RepID=UPI0020189C19|nr:serine/arginine repetitive matrix protein 1-like [Corvus hawaiiensis]